MYKGRPESKRPLAHVLLADFAWVIFLHPSYIPDLAPSDFHVFTLLKQFLGGMHMGSNKEVNVKNWFIELAADSIMQTYRNLSHDTSA
jgi:hypothetical protein